MELVAIKDAYGAVRNVKTVGKLKLDIALVNLTLEDIANTLSQFIKEEHRNTTLVIYMDLKGKLQIAACVNDAEMIFVDYIELYRIYTSSLLNELKEMKEQSPELTLQQVAHNYFLQNDALLGTIKLEGLKNIDRVFSVESN